ncbi:MAG: hypothetical protein WCO71_00550 [Pseudomonadota bacterium]
MTHSELMIEAIGWFSTATFLISIVSPQRVRLHELGLLTSVTTGFYAYSHGATAIWVKWFIAFFFHGWMWIKIKREVGAFAFLGSGSQPQKSEY